MAVQGFPSSGHSLLVLQQSVSEVCRHPVVALHESFVQLFPSSQSMGVYVHPFDESHLAIVHPSPSSQSMGVYVHPFDESQVSTVHALSSSQLIVVKPPHWPPIQPSYGVHGSPSLQGILLGLCTQFPVPDSHESSVHTLPSSHCFKVPTQTPLSHVPSSVHEFPSSQMFPPKTGVFVHPLDGSHPSLVHELLSLQSKGAPAHSPLLQTSFIVHRLPSSHGFVCGTLLQPVSV
jgi:hypothetical protein